MGGALGDRTSWGEISTRQRDIGGGESSSGWEQCPRAKLFSRLMGFHRREVEWGT